MCRNLSLWSMNILIIEIKIADINIKYKESIINRILLFFLFGFWQLRHLIVFPTILYFSCWWLTLTYWFGSSILFGAEPMYGLTLTYWWGSSSFLFGTSSLDGLTLTYWWSSSSFLFGTGLLYGLAFTFWFGSSFLFGTDLLYGITFTYW